jgi:hypothetical protein
MKRDYLLSAFFVLLLLIISCNSRDKGQNINRDNLDMRQDIDIKRCFTIENTPDIGVLNMNTYKDITLYEKPDSTTKFASIAGDARHPVLYFSPKELEHFFDPLYFYYSGSYEDDKGRNSDIANYIIRDWTFRVVSMDDNWIKIVFDEKGHRTCYLKNWKERILYEGTDTKREICLEDEFQTWENYFRGEERTSFSITGERAASRVFQNALITIRNQVLLDKIDGTPILLKKNMDYYFLSDSMRGDWIHLVKYGCEGEKIIGWLKWRTGNKIMIKFTKTFGLE